MLQKSSAQISPNSLKIALLAIFFAGCGGGGSSTTTSTAALSHNACDVIGLQTKILTGTACQAGRSPVLKLYINDGNNSGICSGTLIAPTKFLTAAHCVTNGTFTQTISAGSFSVSQGDINNPIAFGKNVFSNPNPVSELQTIADNAQSRGELAQLNSNTDSELYADYIREFGLSDVAIIELDRAINLPTAPVLVSGKPQVSEVVSIFGYGVTSSDASAGASTDLISGRMSIDSVGPKNILARYDTNGSNSCSGDSGGPMMQTYPDGTFAVVGTVLGGSIANCSAGDLSTFVAMGGDGIQDFLKAHAPEASYR